jgi:DNA-binding response OmpR family regulator
MNRRILVIDDEEPIRNLVSLFLRKNGFVVQTAPTGNAASELLDKGHFDLIILDGDLAGESGLDVLRALRTKGAQMPIVMFTGSLEAELRQKALSAGANAFVKKTEPLNALFVEICRHISS